MAHKSAAIHRQSQPSENHPELISGGYSISHCNHRIDPHERIGRSNQHRNILDCHQTNQASHPVIQCGRATNSCKRGDYRLRAALVPAGTAGHPTEASFRHWFWHPGDGGFMDGKPASENALQPKSLYSDRQMTKSRILSG